MAHKWEALMKEAFAACNRKDWLSAAKSYERALSVAEKKCEISKRILTIGNLAMIYALLGEREKWQRNSTRELELVERVNGKKSPQYVLSLCGAAQACKELKEYKHGLQLANEALKTVNSLGLDEALETPLCLLARLSLDAGLLSEAKKLCACILVHAARYPRATSASARRIANELLQEVRQQTEKPAAVEQLKIWPHSELTRRKRPRAAAAAL